jgi:hypothetical protein
MTKPILLAVEFALLFLGLPLLIYLRLLPNLPIPYLILGGLAVYFLLRRNPSFDSARLFSSRGIGQNLPVLLLRDAFFLILLGLAVRFFAPNPFFSLIKCSPGF